ncbi:hypothetical protein [Aeromonas sp. EERV15]|uniref:hypothetical protein n=1 Tax=Aeromonas sp. EERV15 TaxID=1833892 RepID=UPI00083B3A95|nr:hypothetical protein [Aeromonas sp. EERV15]
MRKTATPSGYGRLYRVGGAFRHTRQGVYRLKVCNASDGFLELDPARFGFIQFKARTGAIFKIERSRGRSPFSTSDPNQNGNRKRRHSDEQVFLRGIGGESLQGMEQNDGHVSLLKLVGSIVETASYKSGVIRLLLLTSREFLNSLQKNFGNSPMHWTVAPIEMGGASGPTHHRVATKTKKPSAKTAAIKPRFVERGLVASVLSSSIMSGLINFWILERRFLSYTQFFNPRRPLCLGNAMIEPCLSVTVIVTLFAVILLSQNNEEGRTG